MKSTEKKHLLDEEKAKLIKMYCESFILTSNVFGIVCHMFDVLLIKWKEKNITLTEQFLLWNKTSLMSPNIPSYLNDAVMQMFSTSE